MLVPFLLGMILTLQIATIVTIYCLWADRNVGDNDELAGDGQDELLKPISLSDERIYRMTKERLERLP